jgi:hypothetical protein
MFTDERAAEYQAITGIPALMAKEISEDIGRPAYLSKEGEFKDSVRGPLERLEMGLMAASLSLSHSASTPISAKIERTQINKWFENSESKAQEKAQEVANTEKLDEDDFTMDRD